MKKNRWVAFLVLLFCIIFSYNLYASSDISVYIDGQRQEFSPSPIIQNGTTLVPMRQCFEKLGAQIEWYDKTRSVIATRDNIKIRISIDNTNAYVNNVRKTLSVAPQLIDEKTYIPLRFISEALGAKVYWDGNIKVITIADKENNIINLVDTQKYRLKTVYTFVNYGDEVDSDFDMFVGAVSNSPYQSDSEIKVSPEPYEYYYDNYGNKYAKIKVSGIKHNQSIDITIEKELDNSGIKYSIDEGNLSSNYENIFNISTYLNPQNMIESDNKYIINKALSLSNGETNPYLIAKNVYSFVNSYIKYDTSDQYARKGALNALITSRGVCEDYSKLFVALLRANKIPSRSVVGFLLKDEVKKEMVDNEWYDVQDLAHEWPEFYLNGYGWIIAEPTFDYTINGKQAVPWIEFANQDYNGHIIYGYEPDDENVLKWSYDGYGKLDLQNTGMSSQIMKLN